MGSPAEVTLSPLQKGEFIHKQLPAKGLFAGQSWRVAPEPFQLLPSQVAQLENLGRVLLQFYRAVNLLYRKSAEGRQPPWIADWLDRGKPRHLVELQRSHVFRKDLPKVIRPDILLTGSGFGITELDSVPGGIGLTAWLNRAYSSAGDAVIGGPDGMLEGFRSIFPADTHVRIVVSEEAATYRPEMEWITAQIDPARFSISNGEFMGFNEGESVYRFFELFDLPNVPNSSRILELAAAGKLTLTPPPKPIFEEKMLFALLWNRNLQSFWRQELGAAFLDRLREMVPYTWLLDPSPLPPQAAYPEINLTDWTQLKLLSQKQRMLILKVSGFSEHAWGARGVYLGSDLSSADWSAAVDRALAAYSQTPFVLQRFTQTTLVDSSWCDFERQLLTPMKGRVRLCPYYFVAGEGDSARAHLGGILATVVPADKKIIHGMSESVLAPCSISPSPHEHH